MITNSLNDEYAKKTVKTSGKHFAKKLYDKGLNSLPTGKHSDGDGLYFIHKADGRKYWAYLFTWHGKAREMFLDKYPALSLANARARTLEYRAMVKNNIDPIEERKQGRVKVNTFGEMATEVMEAKFKEFRNEKHKAQWEQTISFYAKPLLKKIVSEIDTTDILKVLKPIWDTKPETASRLRGRIETILNAAKAKGMRFGENPALWKGHLDNLLPKRQRLTRGHFAALPYQEISKLIEAIRKSGSISTFALEFTILTAARSGEIRGATWDEIDFEKAAWIIPAERMKAGKEHRVPLTARAIEILERMKPLSRGKTSFVFPSRKEGKPLSDMTLAESLKHFNKEVTVHGFRSAFRDWCGEETQYPRELAEAALAHSIGNAVEQAYRRGDALEKRRELMKDWEKHCCTFGQ